MKKAILKLLVLLAFTSSLFFSCEPQAEKKSEQEIKKREEQKEKQRIKNIRMNLITHYSPRLFPPKRFSETKVFTYNLKRYLIDKNGRPVLFNGALDDITKNGGHFVVHFTCSIFSEESPFFFLIDENRVNFHLKCKYEDVEQLIENPPKKDFYEPFPSFFVVCRIEDVRKIINYTVKGYSSEGSEDVELEIQSPDVFSASGELIEMVEY